MPVERMDHVGVVVADLPAAIEFFVAFGRELQGEMTGEGRALDRIVALEGVRTDFAFVRTPDGNRALELIKFRSPPHEGGIRHDPAHTPGLG
jgi:catechol 2,3-dioxygenase-like lactoylglutathione lyase family enzyme